MRRCGSKRRRPSAGTVTPVLRIGATFGRQAFSGGCRVAKKRRPCWVSRIGKAWEWACLSRETSEVVNSSWMWWPTICCGFSRLSWNMALRLAAMILPS